MGLALVYMDVRRNELNEIKSTTLCVWRSSRYPEHFSALCFYNDPPDQSNRFIAGETSCCILMAVLQR